MSTPFSTGITAYRKNSGRKSRSTVPTKVTMHNKANRTEDKRDPTDDGEEILKGKHYKLLK